MDSGNRYGGDSYRTEYEGGPGSSQARKRNIPVQHQPHSSEGIYEELERLRNLVDEVDGRSSCSKGTIGGSMMSTIFGIVLVMILSISVYAFTNLYRALVKRFWPAAETQ